MGRKIQKGIMNEVDIVQNRTVGAHSLYEFVVWFEKNSKTKQGPILQFLMPVLPIVMNDRIKKMICKRNFSEGSLINVLSEDKTVFNTLQENMMRMSDQTFQSLDLAFSAKLLTIDQSHNCIASLPSNIPSQKLNKDYLEILGASKRLGYWFAKFTPEQISNYFNITF